MWDAPHLLAKIIFFDAAKCNKPAAANNSSLQLERAPVPPREAWIVFFSTAFNSTILAQRCKDRRRRTTLPALAAIRNLEHYSSKEQPALKPQLRANGLFEELQRGIFKHGKFPGRLSRLGSDNGLERRAGRRQLKAQNPICPARSKSTLRSFPTFSSAIHRRRQEPPHNTPQCSKSDVQQTIGHVYLRRLRRLDLVVGVGQADQLFQLRLTKDT